MSNIYQNIKEDLNKIFINQKWIFQTNGVFFSRVFFNNLKNEYGLFFQNLQGDMIFVQNDIRDNKIKIIDVQHDESDIKAYYLKKEDCEKMILNICQYDNLKKYDLFSNYNCADLSYEIKKIRNIGENIISQEDIKILDKTFFSYDYANFAYLNTDKNKEIKILSDLLYVENIINISPEKENIKLLHSFIVKDMNTDKNHLKYHCNNEEKNFYNFPSIEEANLINNLITEILMNNNNYSIIRKKLDDYKDNKNFFKLLKEKDYYNNVKVDLSEFSCKFYLEMNFLDNLTYDIKENQIEILKKNSHDTFLLSITGGNMNNASHITHIVKEIQNKKYLDKFDIIVSCSQETFDIQIGKNGIKINNIPFNKIESVLEIEEFSIKNSKEKIALFANHKTKQKIKNFFQGTLEYNHDDINQKYLKF